MSLDYRGLSLKPVSNTALGIKMNGSIARSRLIIIYLRDIQSMSECVIKPKPADLTFVA